MEIGSDSWIALIRRGADPFGIKLEDQALERFAVYGRELLRWNKKINLTAITDAQGIAVKHFLDSLTAVSALPDAGSLLDVGTGAGFPGLPLKIVQPSLAVVLIDASRKKVSFLKHILRLLELDNLSAYHLRADELALNLQPADQGSVSDAGEPIFGPARFDAVISRALASLDDFVRLALPLVSCNGRIIAMKGRLSQTEVDALNRQMDRFLKTSGAGVNDFRVRVKRFRLPLVGAERAVVTILLQGL